MIRGKAVTRVRPRKTIIDSPTHLFSPAFFQTLRWCQLHQHPALLVRVVRQFTGAKTTVYEVYDPLQLPFAAQCMVEKAGVSVVVAIGFLVADAHWCSKEVSAFLDEVAMKTCLHMELRVCLSAGGRGRRESHVYVPYVARHFWCRLVVRVLVPKIAGSLKGDRG